MQKSCGDRDRRAVVDLPEKVFITEVLSRFATTADRSKFEDCMVLDPGGGNDHRIVTVLNIDHPSFIRPSFRTLEDYRFYGRWTAAGVCGDVISMGARPQGFALDLAIPPQIEVCQVEAIMEGVVQVLDRYGGTIAGGNIDLNSLEIVGAAWGYAPNDRLVRRGGARPGDIVVATCVLGVGWAAYLASELGLVGRLPSDLSALATHYKDYPFAPIEPILELAEAGIWTSGMDLSDGLIEFLYTIAERNKCGVRINEAVLGRHALIGAVAEMLHVSPSALALEPGYDFPFAHGYTASRPDLDDITEAFRRHDGDVLVLGEVTAEPGVVLARECGSEWRIPRYWSDQTDSKERRIRRWQELIATGISTDHL